MNQPASDLFEAYLRVLRLQILCAESVVVGESATMTLVAGELGAGKGELAVEVEGGVCGAAFENAVNAVGGSSAAFAQEEEVGIEPEVLRYPAGSLKGEFGFERPVALGQMQECRP